MHEAKEQAGQVADENKALAPRRTWHAPRLMVTTETESNPGTFVDAALTAYS